jgi:inorganic pyrophosphatase
MKERYNILFRPDKTDHYFKSYKQAKKTYNKSIKFNKYIQREKINNIVKEIYERTR